MILDKKMMSIFAFIRLFILLVGMALLEPGPALAALEPGALAISRPVAVVPQEGEEIDRPAPVLRPARLRIPAIGVDTAVEAVGEDDAGRMGTPTQVENVAWYEPGVAPGEIGNAVMAGHLDRVDGKPAVFWALGKLRPGDEILVTDAGGAEYRFQVVQVATYPYDKAPLAEIFGFSLRSRLNLITCRGRWDRKQRTYQERLVVFSEQVTGD